MATGTVEGQAGRVLGTQWRQIRSVHLILHGQFQFRVAHGLMRLLSVVSDWMRDVYLTCVQMWTKQLDNFLVQAAWLAVLQDSVGIGNGSSCQSTLRLVSWL